MSSPDFREMYGHSGGQSRNQGATKTDDGAREEHADSNSVLTGSQQDSVPAVVPEDSAVASHAVSLAGDSDEMSENAVGDEIEDQDMPTTPNRRSPRSETIRPFTLGDYMSPRGGRGRN